MSDEGTAANSRHYGASLNCVQVLGREILLFFVGEFDQGRDRPLDLFDKRGTNPYVDLIVLDLIPTYY
jgi:hypothetical protein